MLKRKLAIWTVLAIVAAIGSLVLHGLFGYGAPLTTAPWLFLLLLAHYIFVDEVRKAETRRTAGGRWLGLLYFAAYLGLLIAVYGINFAQIGLNDSGSGVTDSHDALTGVYFSVITWATVGYGDVTATKPIARFFAAMEALNGYVVLALFIAALVPIFQRLLQGAGNEHERD